MDLVGKTLLAVAIGALAGAFIGSMESVEWARAGAFLWGCGGGYLYIQFMEGR